ncbi:STE23 [Candida oxycetoniae]|uniref:STE23 n=1 Tax=Candida oxycetoniae TaxID=497107 RepID=A0AAI9WWU4_9ASCO|nr:STE23 [Candida oxycetoniae]KAI3403084.2 STE23 [Candida oxycetoniae]
MLFWVLKKYFIYYCIRPSPVTFKVSTSSSLSTSTYSFGSFGSVDRMTELASQYTILADDAQISKPVIDDRHYRFLKLKANDLRVLLIHDPQADKSAAALDVNVGSFADKQYEIFGLAHFCEHLLFMGTSKYPKENEYSNYLSKHSGHSNAYTSSEHTNYYFQVGSNHLEGALDRFAQFFIAPLFSKSCKDREINAVDSENKKNLQSDNWRLYQLDKSNSNPNHPYNGFSTGNYQTLHVEPESKNINVRDALIKFHQDNYSSNLMSLVILGKEDLDTLSAWAIEKFSFVANKQLPRPKYNGELIYTPELLGKLLKAKPVKELNQLELSFMIPDDLEDKWDCKPQNYFSHLLGHESEGSILCYLKTKGWVTELSSGNMNVCQGNSVYMLEFQLTPTGLQNWEKIVVTVFEYLQFVVKDEPKKWIWDEIRNIAEVNFKFKQKSEASSTVSHLSNTLYKFDQFIPPENILNSSVVRRFDPIAIKKFASFLNVDNFRISLVSQDLNNLTKREKWYGTEYEFENIPESLYKAAKSPQVNKQLHYPKPNPFIPTKFDILKKKVSKPQISPYLITHDNKMNTWFKQDDQFEVPRGTIEVVFHLPGANTDIVTSTKSALFVEMLNDHLNQITYFASLVGLKVGINSWRDGFAIVIRGYNDKLPVLLNQVLDEFFNFKPERSRFESIKFKLSKEYKNFGYQVPFQQIGSLFFQLVNEKVYGYEERIPVLEDIEFEDIEQFADKSIWSDGIFAEVLVHGNFDIRDANEIKALIADHIDKIEPMMSEYDEGKFHLQNYVLEPGENIRFEKLLKDENNINSCIDYYLQMSPTNDDARLGVLIDLLATIIREPCFDQLRTKEQLGYVVFSGIKKGRTSLGFRILVQSERASEYLEYRIEEFLKRFGDFVMNELSDDDFIKFKQALKDLKLQKLKHLSEETNRLWSSIIDGYYDFDARSKQVSILENITKEEFIKFYKAYVMEDFGGTGTGTGKLVVHLKSQVLHEPSEKRGIQSALINYSYDNGYGHKMSHEVIEKLVSQEISIDAILDNFAQLVADGDGDTDLTNFKQDLKARIENPTPNKYPTGNLIQSIDEFRNGRRLGGKPQPVASLSKFYYEQSHL